MTDYASEIQYFDVDAMRPEGYLTTILYGDWGKRKTTTACSLIRQQGLLISADNSWKVLLREFHKEIRDKTEIVIYEALSQLDYLDLVRYDTVILDPWSTMVNKFMDLLLEESEWPRGSTGGNRREKLITKNKQLQEIEVPALADYRVVRDKWRPVLYRLLSQPINVVITAHKNNPIPGMSQSQIIRPAIPEATYDLLAQPADIIAYMKGEGRKGITMGVSESSNAYHGKSRVDGIEKEMPQEDFITAYHNYFN